jgi:hypothetical protein
MDRRKTICYIIEVVASPDKVVLSDQWQLASIPYPGWLIAAVGTLFGLGAIWILSSPRKQPEAQSGAQQETADENQDLSVAPEG